MRNVQPRMSLHAYGLIFAAVLSPAWLQVSGCPSGNPNLAALEFEVDGVDQLNWVFGIDQYQVTMSSPTAVLRVQSVDPDAEIRYQWWADGVTYVDMWSLGQGDVEAEIDILEGYNLLRIDVRAPGGKRGFTNIEITNSLGALYACTEAGIRQAISDGGGPHYFDCAGPTTLLLGAPFEQFHTDVILDGEDNITLDGRNLDNRVFNLLPGDTVELRGLTVTGAGPSTAAILNQGTLTLTDTTITGNTRGGITNRSTGALILDRSTVSGNTGWGGIDSDGASVTAIDSTISNNTGNQGGGIRVTAGTLTLRNTTVSGNSAVDGGGMYVVGDTNVGATNTTVSGNSATGQGGGIYAGGTATIDLAFVTVFGNTAAEGDAGYGADYTAVTYRGGLIEGTCVSGTTTGTVVSYGYNVQSPVISCIPAVFLTVGDEIVPDAGLGRLQDNDGPTLTHAPVEGSIALDLVDDPSACLDHTGAPLTRDQRGIIRQDPPDNTNCDAGAVEGYCPDCGDDGNECTVGACDPATRACVGSVPVPDGTLCDLGDGECVTGVCEAIREWGTPQLISDRDVSQSPSVAMDPQGNAIAVWPAWLGGSNYVMSSRFSLLVGWGTPEAIDTETGWGSAQVAMDPQGNAVAVWDEERAPNHDFWGNHYTPLAGWETARLIEEHADLVWGPFEVAMDAQGNAVAVWQEREEIPNDFRTNLWSNRYTPSGGWGIAAPLENTDGSATLPRLAMSDQGEAMALWRQRQDAPGATDDIWFSRYTPASGWETPQPFENNAGTFDVAMDPQGNAVAVWTQSGNVWSRRYTPSGGWGPAGLIENMDDALRSPKVAMDAQGNALAIWGANVDALNRYSVWANRFAVSGGWDTPQLVSRAGGDYYTVAWSIEMNAEGKAIAVWQQDEDGSGQTLGLFNWSNRFTPAGGWGTSQLIGAEHLPTEHRPDIAMDSEGNAVAVWRGGLGNVWANRFVHRDLLCAGISCPPASGECGLDACDAATGACYVPNWTPCDAGTGWCMAGECDLCAGVTCTPDGNPCTADYCDAGTGACNTILPDGTACDSGNGQCIAGVCKFPCTEEGLRRAVALGGWHTFSCDQPIMTTSEIAIDNTNPDTWFFMLEGSGQGLTVQGAGDHPVFRMEYWAEPCDPFGPPDARFDNVTITGGNPGIVNDGCQMDLVRVKVTGNAGRGIENNGVLELRESTVSGNSAAYGAGIHNWNALYISDSTISGNNAYSTVGGGIWNMGDMSIDDSTISGNTAQQDGAAIYNGAGGWVYITHSTIVRNTVATPGGGDIYNDDPFGYEYLRITKSLIDGNCSLPSLASVGYNIESPGDTCGLGGDATNSVDVNPLMVPLGDLQDNGGPTDTHLPLLPAVTNLVIDYIPESECGFSSEDQRDVSRPQPAGGWCDVGSVEVYQP